ncbi:MAG: hypothetical protein RI967_1040 [Planctomycetota bacterium]
MSAPTRFIGASQSDERSPEMMKMRAIAAVAASVGAMASGASAQEAVQWRVEDGGNGHWYRGLSEDEDISWLDADRRTRELGGHLATVTSAAEDDFVWAIAADVQLWTVVRGPGVTGAKGPWLGLFQAPGSAPETGWSWVTGEPFEFNAWASGEPNDGCSIDENALNYLGDSPAARRWNDFPGDVPCEVWGFPRSCIIEWSADCNADGVVDYGQILAGDLVDANGNNIPDCCEENAVCATCAAADLIPNGQIDGVDLALLISAWGTDGGKFPETDIDRDGIVAGSDLALLLSYWGPCD